MKRCRVCGVEKSLDEFHKYAKSPDGRQYRCKVCSIAAARQWNLDHPEAVRAAAQKNRQTAKSKAWYKARRTGEQRETILAQKRAYLERNRDEINRTVRERRDPVKEKARYARYYALNKERILARNREYGRANAQRARDNKLRRDFGITLEQLNQMVADQNGCCKICGTQMHPGGDRENGVYRTGVCVDHDHETGGVRGVICSPCNTGLGMFKDDPARMRAAADYIDKYRKGYP
jgi:Recombination endonuclease VII